MAVTKESGSIIVVSMFISGMLRRPDLAFEFPSQSACELLFMGHAAISQLPPSVRTY